MAGPPKTSQNGPAGSKSTTAPNQTLYLTNLPDKIPKQELRLELYTLFATYGPVLDVNAMKGGMRGQAHVAFRDVQTATQAMRSLNGFEFLGSEIKIQYAKGKSDVVAKLDGTYRMGRPGHPGAGGGLSGATELQQQIFGAPPSSLPQKLVPTARETSTGMEVDGKADEPKGVKRGREDDEDEEDSDQEAPMEEDSDASMEEASDDND